MCKITKKKKIFFIVGETSGDAIAADIIDQIDLNLAKDEVEYFGIAGELMIAKGVKPILNSNQISMLGFFEIIKHLSRLLSLINFTAKKIAECKPDLVISIDSWGFCYHTINKAKKKYGNLLLQTKFIHIVAPKVWLYHRYRAQQAAKILDLMLTIFPFEPKYFQKYGLDSYFIGHPTIEKISSDLYEIRKIMDTNYQADKKSIDNFNISVDKINQIRQEIKIDFCKNHDLDSNLPIILVTIGSRKSEVENLIPIYKEVIINLAEKYENLQIVTPTFELFYDQIKALKQEIIKRYNNVEIIITSKHDDAKKLFLISDIAIAKSGTNTLELALLQTPMLVCYSISNATYLLIKIARKLRLININFANILNILENKEIIPEFIGPNCRAELITNKLIELLENPVKIREQQELINHALKKFYDTKIDKLLDSKSSLETQDFKQNIFNHIYRLLNAK